MRFLILTKCVIVFVLIGCSAPPAPNPDPWDWEFVERPGLPTKACIGEEDVSKLREALIRCKEGNQ